MSVRILSILLLILATVTSTPARPHPWHYIATHKELLVADAIVIAAAGADVGSSIHCQRVGHQYCVESGALFLPAHPNAAQNAVYGYGEAAVLVTANHLIWHYAPERSERHLFWFVDTAYVIDETFNVKSNVDSAEKIQRCYRVGLCK